MASQINSTQPQTRRPNSATEQPASRATQYVNQQLEKTRRGVKSNDLLAGLLTVFAGALAFMLAVALWDAWVAELSVTGRWLALITLIMGCLAYSTLSLLPLMIRRINPDYAAKMIEDAKPSFKNSLLNYVSLRRTDATISPAVLDAVSRQAASDLSTVPADATVDRSKLIRIGFALIGLMILIVGYKMLSPKDPLQTFGRILAPNAKIARPAVVRVSDVQPGDTQIFFGDTVEVTAVVRGSHQPGDVKIEFSTIDGERSRQTISMQTTEAKDRYRAQLSENGIGIGQSLTYRVVARDGSSPDYTIDVRPNPTIAVESLTLIPPAYTQLPKRTFSGSGAIEAVEGTEVRIEAVANLPIKVAYIELLEALPAPKANNIPNSAATTTGNEYRVIRSIEMNATEKNAAASFIALLNAARDKPIATHYQIKFVSTNDDRNQKPNVYPIRIIPDLAPEITITHPLDRDIYLPQNGTLAIDIEASDLDYEISAIKLRIDHAATSLLDANLELRSSSANSRNDRVTARYQLTPEKLGLVAGDKAIFFATAADNRTSPHSGQPDPNIARTENFTLNVTSPEKPSDPNEQGSNEDDFDKQNPDQKSPDQKSPDEKSSDAENPDREPAAEKEDREKEAGEEGSSSEDTGEQNGSEQMPNEQNGEQQNGDQQSGEQQSGDQQNGGEQGSGEQGSGEQGSGEQGSGEQDQPSSGGQSTDSASNNDSASSGGTDNAGDSNNDSSSNQAPRDNDSPNDNRSPSSNSGGSGDSQNGEQYDPNLQNGEKQPLGKNASDGERFKRLQEHYEQQQKENRGSNGSDGEKQSDQQSEKNQANENRAGEEDATDNSSSDEPNGDESSRDESSRDKASGEKASGEKTSGDKDSGDKASGEKASNEEPADDQASSKGNTGDKSDDSQSNSNQSTPPASKGDSSTGDPKDDDPENGDPKNGDPKNGERGDGEPKNDDAKKGEPENGQPKNEQPTNGESGGQQQPDQKPPGSSDSNKDSAEQGGGEKQPDSNKPNGEAGTEKSSSGDSSDQESGSPSSQPSAEQNGSPSDPSGDSPDGQPMPGDSSSNQKSDSSSDKSSAGDKATAGGSGSGSGELPSQQIEKEAANLQHAQQATDLILEKLDQQKYEPDQKLLDELNWSETEMADFLKRWNAMKRAAEAGDLGAKRKYEQSLKSLGLRPEDGRRTVRQNEDAISGLNEDNAVIEPPPELAPDFNATLRDLNRSR